MNWFYLNFHFVILVEKSVRAALSLPFIFNFVVLMDHGPGLGIFLLIICVAEIELACGRVDLMHFYAHAQWKVLRLRCQHDVGVQFSTANIVYELVRRRHHAERIRIVLNGLKLQILTLICKERFGKLVRRVVARRYFLVAESDHFLIGVCPLLGLKRVIRTAEGCCFFKHSVLGHRRCS